MGLLSKLFKNTQTTQSKTSVYVSKTDSKPAPIVNDSQANDCSWGETMPHAENQYNYRGPYWAYFENIFKSDFGDLQVKKAAVKAPRFVYMFYSGSTKVLVVELMSESGNAQKIRQECKDNNIPYLRFYINHHGWWNTRDYVVKRMRDALMR